VRVRRWGPENRERPASEVVTEYRVVIWEQPLVEGINPETVAWGEATHDLSEVRDVHQVIEWANAALTGRYGRYSGCGVPVRDREYVLYAKAAGQDQLAQIAGWDPTRHLASPNLPRRTT
jgi:hypothetical protein